MQSIIALVKRQPLYFAFVSLLAIAAITTAYVAVSRIDTRVYASPAKVKGISISRPIPGTTIPSGTSGSTATSHLSTESPSNTVSGSSVATSPASPITVTPTITKITGLNSSRKDGSKQGSSNFAVSAIVSSTSNANFDFTYMFYFGHHSPTPSQKAHTKTSNTISGSVELAKCDVDTFYVVVTWNGGSMTSSTATIDNKQPSNCSTTTTTTTTTKPSFPIRVPITRPHR